MLLLLSGVRLRIARAARRGDCALIHALVHVPRNRRASDDCGYHDDGRRYAKQDSISVHSSLLTGNGFRHSKVSS
jgi:hypothetical protein